jgi:hypothetical protein
MKKKTETYWVIDTEAPGEHEGSRSAYGPFKSHAAAAAFLVRDAGTLLRASDEDLRHIDAETWAAPMHICKVVAAVQQVPQIRIDVHLKKVAPEARYQKAA